MQENGEKKSELNFLKVDYYAWKAANIATVVGATSFAISVFHNPLNEYMYAKLSNNPFSSTRIWLGFSAYITATLARTTYMTGAKKYDMERSMSAFEISFYASIGDVVSSQGSEVLSQVRKLPVDMLQSFNWKTKHNLYKLATTTVGARFGFAYTNFITLCMIEPIFIKNIQSFDETHTRFYNSTLNYLLTGFTSGTCAALLSFPFSFYRDYRLKEASIINGKLSVPSILDTYRQLIKYSTSIGVKNLFTNQVMPRIARTSSRFSLFFAVGGLLGDEPLKNLYPNRKSRLGFFNADNTEILKESPIQKNSKNTSNKV